MELDHDQRLFQTIEDGHVHQAFRTWEVVRPAVVLGRHNRLADHVDEQACRRDDVPILRRASGGGSVVIASGCVNYAFAASFVSHPALRDVARSFAVILRSIATGLGVEGLSISGGADVVMNGRKVSGNAQRRGRHALLHHGTVLYAFDAALATRYLREPARQPAYRAARSHAEFLGNVPLSREALCRRLEHALAALAAESAIGTGS